jgi:hypothetical protein
MHSSSFWAIFIDMLKGSLKKFLFLHGTKQYGTRDEFSLSAETKMQVN